MTQPHTQAVEETSDIRHIEDYDEHLLITREFTHVDSSEDELHRLGYYWPAQMAAFPLVK